ncbi:MAG: DNA repair protein RecN [Lachnospiraceae bacterium]|nr:DNA repair protein RecN [Lachnospiraceae bacterium]
MLESLKVKNLALIENCETEFTEGLNILTGETGAGKSILLGSVNLALGARAEGDIIRSGADEASVELVFSNSERISSILKSMDISSDEDVVIIQRKITPSKSIFKINGETVLSKQVKELAGELIDIHGQHEHQSLLNTVRQRDMIDAYGGEKTAKCLSEVSFAAENYVNLLKEQEEALSKADGREREISLLEYEIKEIEEAKLVPGEDEELEEAYKRMQSSEKLTESANEAMNLISGDVGQDAGALISRAINALNRVSSIDPKASELEDKLKEAEDILGDFSLELSKYIDKLEYDPDEFDKTEKRLDLLNTLKSRFGRTIDDVIKYCEDKTAELERLKNLDEYLCKLSEKLEDAKKEYIAAATRLTEARKEASEDFSVKLTETLKELNFLDVKFYVNIDSDYSNVTKQGSDSLEFMISTNPGEPVKPVKNVASGGELSRIILGIKTILADKDDIDSLIFDEIDAGISGITARDVGKKLKVLSKRHQVISITHLAQIAAMADSHFVIEKGVSDGKTKTTITAIDEALRVKELARLLGGDENSEAALNNARELLKNTSV